jgi:hypothetical protein
MAVVSFGLVTVTTGGTPVNAAANILDQLAPGEPVLLQSVLVQAHFNNTGKVYVLTAMPTPPVDRRATLVGAIAVLPAPADPTDGPFPSASVGVPLQMTTMDLRQLWIDADVSGNGVIISGTFG